MNATDLARKERRILIVGSDAQVASRLERVCRSIDVDAQTADDAGHAMTRATQENWDGAILDMAEGGPEMLAVADALTDRLVTVIFVSNGHAERAPQRYAHAPRLLKPLQRERIVHLVATCAAPDVAPPRPDSNPVLAAILAEADDLRRAVVSLPLQARQAIVRPGRRLNQAIFVESGMCSVIGKLGDNETEIGLIGAEGMIGGWLAAGVETVPYRINVQIEGVAAALPAERLIAATERNPTVRNIVMRCQHDLDMQFVAAATANATLRIECRLARWLAMCSDRIGLEIPIVHENLSMILSVRRSGVTEAFRRLEQAGLVASKRGFVRVLDREGLERFSLGLRGRE